jgi:hypothetical protein
MVSSPISVQFPGAGSKRKQRGGKLSRMPGAGLVFQWSQDQAGGQTGRIPRREARGVG